MKQPCCLRSKRSVRPGGATAALSHSPDPCALRLSGSPCCFFRTSRNCAGAVRSWVTGQGCRRGPHRDGTQTQIHSRDIDARTHTHTHKTTPPEINCGPGEGGKMSLYQAVLVLTECCISGLGGRGARSCSGAVSQRCAGFVRRNVQTKSSSPASCLCVTRVLTCLARGLRAVRTHRIDLMLFFSHLHLLSGVTVLVASHHEASDLRRGGWNYCARASAMSWGVNVFGLRPPVGWDTCNNPSWDSNSPSMLYIIDYWMWALFGVSK